MANVIEYAVAVARMETILPEDLPEEIRVISAAPAVKTALAVRTARATPSQCETAADSDSKAVRLLAALQTHHWKRAETAAALGISRATLWRLIREMKLE